MNAMFLNNFKIAYRNLIRNKAYSFINISGLAIGMACTILLLLWVNHELSYDKFHKDSDQLYQIVCWQPFNSTRNAIPNLPGLLTENVKEKYPEVEYASNYNFWGENLLLEYGDKKQYVRIKNADPDFFKIFNFPLIQGNPETCLQDINSMVITERAAKKIFGNENPIGKIVKVDNRQPLTISGVVKTPPTNSSVQFDYLSSFELLKKHNPYLKYWGTHMYYGYVKLAKGTDVEAFNKKIDNFYKEYVDKESEKGLFVFPIKKKHLYGYDGKPYGKTRVNMYFLISVFILAIACFNFMNLSTARSAKRAKEIGMKKAIGATYPQLIRQFLGESILITLVATNFAILLAHLFLPQFNTLMFRNLKIDYSSMEFWMIIAGVTLLTGLLAGAYPALYLSSFNPIAVLKGTFTKGKKGNQFRKVLVVIQFILASSLLICTLTIVLQTRYLTNMDTGLDKENVISVSVNQDMKKRIETIKTELLNKSYVENASYGDHIPYRVFSNGWGEDWEGKDPNFEPLITYPRVDANFDDTFKTEMAEGRFFNENNPSADSSCVVINETFAKLISKESVANKTIRKDGIDYRIIGVLKDYHCTPNDRKLQPFLMRLSGNPNYLFVRYTPGNASKAIQEIERVCSKYSPNFPLVYEFLTANYNSMYEDKRSTIQTLLYASILAILVSCLGLFGLASFTAEERTKEVGVRKVLGASMHQLIMIFSKDFGKWIIISSIISWPISYYAMEQWFDRFPFRIAFPFWLFIAVLVTLLIVALITIGYQSWKSATKNPVVSLKYE